MFQQTIDQSHIIAFVGTGGVGKTTLSIAVALQAAQQGKKVAAITIDPSKRLGKVLGLENESYKSLNWPEFQHPMDVFFLDVEKVFNEFVETKLPEKVFSKILDNKIYKQISRNLRETHNFAAIYQLEKIMSQGEYDLIVLDTPPCHQVIDFFKAPELLQKFFTPQEAKEKSGWIDWVKDKSFEMAEGVLKNLAGRDFLSETEEFFKNIGHLKSHIYQVSENFLSYMRDEKSHVFLISSPALDKLAEAEYLQVELSKRGYAIHSCLINRAFNPLLDQCRDEVTIQDPEEKELYNYFIGQKQKSINAVNALRKKKGFSDTHFVLLPELESLTEDKGSLVKWASQIDEYSVAIDD